MKSYFTKIDRVWKLAPIYLVLIMILGLSVKGWFFNGNDNIYHNQNTVLAEKNIYIREQISVPIRIEIPRLNINLPIQEGFYNEDYDAWTINNEKAFFASQTSFPNTKEGMTLIYGHNINNIFRDLRSIDSGDIVYIQTKNDDIYVYQYMDSRLLKPTDTTIFNYVGDPELHLLTCTDSIPKQRRDMRFTLLGIKAVR